MDRLEAAALIGGVSRAENKPVSQPTNVHFVTMEAVSSSEDGTVLVDPGGDVFSLDDSQYVEIETVGSVTEGDEITVALVGEPGGGMDVISLGPVGEGDAQNESIEEAATTATKYVTDLGDDGIWVTPEDAKPEDGAAVATTSGWHIADALELWRKGVRMLKAYAASATETVIEFLDGTVSLSSAYEETTVGDVTSHKTTIGLRNTYAEQFGVSGVRAVVEYDETSGPMPGQVGSSFAGIYADTGDYDAEVGVNADGDVLMRGSSLTVAWPDSGAMVDGSVGTEALYLAVSGGMELFSGSYEATRASAVTLSESAANFSLLRVFVQDGDGQVTSVDVHEPNGKTFAVTMSTATQQYLYVKSKSFAISGTSITCASSGGTYRHGQARLGSSGVTWDQSAELIGVVRVVGYR